MSTRAHAPCQFGYGLGLRCPNASVRPGRALARAYPTAKLATLLLMLASSPQVEQLGLAIRFDCSDIGGDKGMVVGRRMRNEQPEAVARVRVGHETSSIETIRPFRAPVPNTGFPCQGVNIVHSMVFPGPCRVLSSRI